jgi:glycosyltransferase involved in cell wall biosynthesis
MSPPRVLMAHPSAELYGSDRVFVESAAALLDVGWAVTVTLPGDGPLVAVLREHGAKVEFCPTPVLRKAALRPKGFAALLAQTARALPRMRRLLKAERPDVVYVNTVTVPLWLVLGRTGGRRVIGHVHEAESGVPAPVRAGLAAPLLAAHTVLVNSEATADVVTSAISLLRGRTELVYNGVAGPPRQPEVADAPRRPVRIVLVGRLSPRKGSDLAIEAVAALRAAGHDVHLDLVGSVFPGYEWYEEGLRRQIAEHRLEDSVRLPGFTADVWSAYRDADIALVPSRVEPFGNTAVEAQLAGVPVIVSDVQGLPETVRYGEHGLIVPPDDPSAIVEAVLALLEDWPRAAATARKALAHVTEEFAPKRYRERIATIAKRVGNTGG